MGVTSSGQLAGFEALHRVMQQDPNMGSLRRAMNMTRAGWGRTFNQAERVCETYAPLIKDYHMDPLTKCSWAIWEHDYPQEMNRWATTLLAGSTDPELIYYRVKRLFSWGPMPTEADIEFVLQYLSRDDVIWPEIAETFDMNYPQKYRYPYLYETHQRRAHARALEKLEHNPHDPDVIEVLRKKFMQGGKHFDQYGQPFMTDVSLTTPEFDRELVRRLLTIAPYDPCQPRPPRCL